MEINNMKFKDTMLSDSLKKALSEAGYINMTAIQEKTIPLILEGKDLIGQSQTGTGKTASYSLPLIEKIDNNLQETQAIILCPTRELAIQITEEIRKFTKYEENIKVLSIYGGEPIERQIKKLKKGIKIIVGTPGRIMDHMRRKTVKLNNIKMVVLDEADEMLNMGFEEDIKTILSAMPKDRQTILFSATMNERILKIANKYLKNPKKVKIKAKELTVDKIEQISIEVKQSMKDETVMRLIDINNPKKAVVFCNTKKKVDNLIDVLKKNKYRAESLHGDMKQIQRQKIMDKLKNGEIQILVTTDVVARGIDVDELELVINYDIPQEEEYYVHRIGRTGRNGKNGKAYTFFVGKEKNKIYHIQKYAKTKIIQGKIPTISQIEEIKNKQIKIKIQEEINNYKPNKQNEKILTELVKENDIQIVAKTLLNMLYHPIINKEENEIPEKGKMIKIFLNIGKKDCIKAKDIVGSMSANTAISGKEIGKINVLDNFSFVELPSEYLEEVLRGMKGKKIKGKEVNVEIANAS